MTVYCNIALNLFTKNWKHIQLCVSFVDSLIHLNFSDSNTFNHFFKSQIMTLSQQFGKSSFFGQYSFTQLLHDVKNWEESIKYLGRSYKCTTYRLDSKENATEAAQVSMSVKSLQYWKNPGMLWFSSLQNGIFATTCSHT